MAPVERVVGHPYSDVPAGGIVARSYAYEEIFAEKVRALGERTRPRDLYDVVNLFRHGEFRPAAAGVLDVLRKKCGFKKIEVPTFASLVSATPELTADWAQMLGHQLPVLPPFEAFWNALPEFFGWLEGRVAPRGVAREPLKTGNVVIRPAIGFLRRQGVPGSAFLEGVRFAASNHLCVDLGYDGSVRRIEPYSLQRTLKGDILLRAVSLPTGEPRSYRLDRIQSARVTEQSFVPRFAIELTPDDSVGALPGRHLSLAPRRGLMVGGSPPVRRTSGPTAGLTYVYQCGACGKKFPHKNPNPRIGPHKAPGGWACSGRSGSLTDTRA